MKSCLDICGLRVPVQLGVSAEERSQPQNVDFEVHIRFDEIPQGCETDQILDVLDYSLLCNDLHQVATSRPFHLIEAIAQTTYEALRKRIGSQPYLRVTVHKLYPPIVGLQNGVKFTLES